MPRLTPERKAEIREWLIQPKHYLRPPTGQEVGAMLDEVDALRVDSAFLNEAVIEACADLDYFARLVERLEDENRSLKNRLSQVSRLATRIMERPTTMGYEDIDDLGGIADIADPFAEDPR